MIIHKCDLCGSTNEDVGKGDRKISCTLPKEGDNGVFLDIVGKKCISSNRNNEEIADLCDSCWKMLLGKMCDHIKSMKTSKVGLLQKMCGRNSVVKEVLPLFVEAIFSIADKKVNPEIPTSTITYDSMVTLYKKAVNFRNSYGYRCSCCGNDVTYDRSVTENTLVFYCPHCLKRLYVIAVYDMDAKTIDSPKPFCVKGLEEDEENAVKSQEKD